MGVIKPTKLRKGDVIGIISPASPADESKIEKGVNYLEKLGYRVKVGKNVGKSRGYLAGSDEERLFDLHSMFLDNKVKAVFAVRGGYGTIRLLKKINYSLIKRNPKIFVGYSDITSLQMAILKKTGLVTFAGPMPAVDFGRDEISEFTEENFWRIITNSKKVGKFSNPNDEKFFVLNKGRSQGRIIGGNLAVFNSLLGSRYIPSFKDSILLLEDIGEVPYRIDRLLAQLSNAGAFNSVNAVILGRFVDCYDTEKTKDSICLNDVIVDYFSGLKLPVIYNFKHGHITDNLTVPFGLNCKLNTSRCFIEITESAVQS